jgi:hypothetical protein
MKPGDKGYLTIEECSPYATTECQLIWIAVDAWLRRY